MDLYCPVCGEPWDVDELHDVEGKTFAQARRDFQKKGCAVFGNAHNQYPDTKASSFARTMNEVLGDDIDGIAAMADMLDYA